jgi:hypothetical protein
MKSAIGVLPKKLPSAAGVSVAVAVASALTRTALSSMRSDFIMRP